jgi:hypothetical protein
MKLAYSIRAACAILESKGLTEKEIIDYIKKSEKPTKGYVYIK